MILNTKVYGSYSVLIDQFQSHLRGAYVSPQGVIKFTIQTDTAFNLDDVFLGRVVQKDESFFWVDIGTSAPVALPRKRDHNFNDGDLTLVQILRLPMVDKASLSGMKGVRLSTNLHFVGRFCTFHPFKKNPNIILRGAGKSLAHLAVNEADQLQSIYKQCLQHKTIGLCWKAPTPIERMLRDAPADSEVIFENELVATQFQQQQKQFDHLNYRIANLRERPILTHFGVDEMWDAIIEPHVQLPHGGGIYIDEGACATTIDVNSGGENPYQQNLHAAAAICQHIALRQLNGSIMVDFAGSLNATQRKKIVILMSEEFKKWHIKDVKILGWSHLEFLEILRPRYANSIPVQITQISE